MTDFSNIYSRYAPDIYRFVYGLTLDRRDAQDITAETFARALTAYNPERQPTVRAFLYTIAHRLVTDYHRRKRNTVEPDEDSLGSDAAFDLQSEQRDLLESTLRYLNTLPQEDREAVLMRAQGLSYAEISAALGITVSAAKVRVHRTRLKLAIWKTDKI